MFKKSLKRGWTRQGEKKGGTEVSTANQRPVNKQEAKPGAAVKDLQL